MNNFILWTWRELSLRLSRPLTLSSVNGQQQRVTEPFVPIIRQSRTGFSHIALAILLSFSSLIISSSANAEDFDGLSYTLNNPTNGQARLDGLSDAGASKTEIDIPATVKINNQTYSVTSVKKTAFAGAKLTALIIPTSVTSVGDYAFANNELTDVTLADNTTHIADGMFFGNPKLLSITIPESVISIGAYAFQNSGLTSLIIPDSVTRIDQSAFKDSKELTSLTLGGGLLTIGGNAFQGTKITRLVIPNSVTSIGVYAFSYIDKLTSLTLGEGLLQIGELAFAGADDSIIEHLVIPNSVIRIEEYAFKDKKIDTLVLGSGLTYLGNNSFVNSNLTGITFLGSYPSSGTTSIRAFDRNSGLETIDACNKDPSWIGKSINNIAVNVDCDFTVDRNGLTYNLNNPGDGEATVTGRASGNSSTSISIADTVTRNGRVYKVTHVGASAFAGNSLTDVGFAGTLVYDYSTANYVTTYNIVNIGDLAFAVNDLSNFVFPNSVNSIGSNAFSANTLSSVDFRGDYYGDQFSSDAFSSNQNLEYINSCNDKANWSNSTFFIDSANITVTSVYCMFSFSYNITNSEAKITGFSDDYLDGVFAGQTVIIPDEVSRNGTTYLVTEISNLYQNSLTSVTIGKNIKTINNWGFAENDLTSVIIPASVIRIYDSAFADNNLTSVMFLGNNPGSNSFDNDAFGYESTLNTINACLGSDGWEGVSFNNVPVSFVSCEISYGGLAYELTGKVESTSNAFEYYQLNVASSIQTSCSGCHGASKTNIGALKVDDSLANYTVLSKYISDGFGATLLSKVRGENHTQVFAAGSTDYNVLSEFLTLESDTSNSGSTFAAATVLGRAAGSDDTDIVIPDTMTWNGETYPVTSIAPDAFLEKPITSVTIGNNVLDIGDYAFMTTRLSSVTFGNSVTTIGVAAFYQHVPGGGLTSVSFPNSLTSIGESAFCSQKLTSVSIPANVASIGQSAFCDITSVSFLGDYSTGFDTDAFRGNPDLSVEACFDSTRWMDVSFLTTQTNSNEINVKVTYCSSVYVNRIAESAETNNGTNLAFSDLTSAGIESLVENNFAAYLAAIVAADSITLDTLAKIQALVDEVNASGGNNGSPTRARNDVNGDGKADIIWRNKNFGNNVLWAMNGLSIASNTGINTVANQAWQIAGRGDFDGDGKSDLLWRNNESGQNVIYLMDGAKIVDTQTLNVVNLSWEIKAVGDFDGDGKYDIFWRNTQGDTAIYLMNGTKITSSANVTRVANPNWEFIDTGDVNGDGKDDLVWRHKIDGVNVVWLMNGLKISKSYPLNTVSVNWLLVGLGDLNGDGIDDFIWRNKLDGRNHAYLMNGSGEILNSQSINVVPNLDWRVADILDLNGDGKDDLFWRDVTGRSYIYLMNGLEIQESTASNNVGDAWQNIR